MDALYAQARFDYRDLDARLRRVGKSNKSALHATKQTISIKLATTLGLFLRDLGMSSLFVCFVKVT